MIILDTDALSALMKDQPEEVVADWLDHQSRLSMWTARTKAGRPVELRDTMIAGIALAHDATVGTPNTAHFRDLSVPDQSLVRITVR